MWVLGSNSSVTGLTVAENNGPASPSRRYSSRNTKIRGNVIRENGGGIGLNFSLEVDVRDNRIVENTGYGLHAVRAGNSVFENNVVARNGLDGFSLDNTNATIQGNTFRRNGGTGLWIIERVCSAIASYGIGGNEADANGALGIDFHTDAFACAPGEDPAPLFAIADRGGNLAAQNGDPRECVNVMCSRNRGVSSFTCELARGRRSRLPLGRSACATGRHRPCPHDSSRLFVTTGGEGLQVPARPQATAPTVARTLPCWANASFAFAGSSCDGRTWDRTFLLRGNFSHRLRHG